MPGRAIPTPRTAIHHGETEHVEWFLRGLVKPWLVLGGAALLVTSWQSWLTVRAVEAVGPYVAVWLAGIAVLRKAREPLAEARASDTRQRTLFESSGDGVLVLEAGRFCDSNPAALSLFGLTATDILGTSPVDVSPVTRPSGRPSAEAATAVSDNGRGLPPAQARGRSLGLLSMRESMRMVGGICEVTSRLGGGTVVCARLLAEGVAEVPAAQGGA